LFLPECNINIVTMENHEYLTIAETVRNFFGFFDPTKNTIFSRPSFLL
jgi:hypothetical protein